MGYEIEWSNLLTFCYNVYCAYIHRFEWTGLDWSTRSFVFIARWKKPMSIPDSNYKRHANDQNQNGIGMGMRMEMDLDTSQTDRWRFLVIYWNSIRFFFLFIHQFRQFLYCSNCCIKGFHYLEILSYWFHLSHFISAKAFSVRFVKPFLQNAFFVTSNLIHICSCCTTFSDQAKYSM